MAQKQVPPVQELPAAAQFLSLDKAAAAKLMASRVERRGSEITGITIVRPLGEDKYLSSRLPDAVVSALKQKLASISSPAEKAGLLGAWMTQVQHAMQDEYLRATSANPKLTVFDYTLPSFDMPKSESKTSVPSFVAPKNYILSKGDVILHTTVIQKSESSEKIPPLPAHVTGKGTETSPYVVDVSEKSTANDETGSLQFVMPLALDIGLDKPVNFKFILTASQVRQVKDEKPNAPFITGLRSTASQAMAVSCNAQHVPYEGDVYSKAEDALKRLGASFVSFTSRLKDDKVKAYFGK